MAIDKMHDLLAGISSFFHLDVLSSPEVSRAIKRSLDAHGKLRERRMPLHAQLVFWLVILLTLRRERSIPDVFGILIDSCRSLAGGLSRKAITDGGLARARQRLGAAPLKTFFEEISSTRSEPWFYGMRPVAADGVRLTMPDTEKNLGAFPRQTTGRGRAAWPQMLAVCFMDIACRMMIGACFGTIHDDERSLARCLWSELRREDLLVEDKGFFKKEDFFQLNSMGIRFLCKMPASCKKLSVIHEYGAGDVLVELRGRRPRMLHEVPDHRKGRPGNTKKFRLRLRLISYSIDGTKHQILTNVFDREISPAEFACAYHWRWDAEIAYDELKVHLMTVNHGKAKTVFRSKSPELVEQEFWAMLSTYNLVRGVMRDAGERHEIDPLELSFTGSLRVIEDALLRIQHAQAENLPRLHRRLLLDVAECRLDRPRRPRKWPRVVKSKMSNFRVKTEQDHEVALVLELEFSPLNRVAS